MKRDALHQLGVRSDVSRRDALKLIAGGIAALGAGCIAKPGADVLPYVEDPEHNPGTPVRYASALELDGFATGVLVTTREGRPIKIDGNPAHPASLGGSLPWMQASLLELYDPARIALATRAGLPTTIASIVQQIADTAGPLWIIMPPQSSPTVAALLARIAARRELHVVYDTAIDHRDAYRGHALVFGEPVEQHVDFASTDVVVSFDADWAARGPLAPAWARAAAARRPTSRWWTFEPMPTPTGTLSDHRVATPAGDMAAVALVVLSRLGARGVAVPALPAELVARARASLRGLVQDAELLADDLADHRGRGVVLVGDRQPPIVHALARWIDEACQNHGSVATFRAPVIAEPLASAALGPLEGTLLAIDANPALRRRVDLSRVRLAVWAGTHASETAEACSCVLPLTHALEAWADPRACDGTLAIAQPVIQPRFPAISPIELLAALAAEPASARELVERGVGDRRDALARGVVAGSALPVRAVAATWNEALIPMINSAVASVRDAAAIEIALAPSQVHDGRFAHNAWLQELPHPITKQTWGNAALISPATAAAAGIRDSELVRVATATGSVTLPAILVDGHADACVSIELGYGRDLRGLAVADGIGANGFQLADTLVAVGTVQPLGRLAAIARTQTTFSREDREVAVDADHAVEHRGPLPSLLPAAAQTGPQWAMSIDTSLCTGCNACVVACQAENNIPVVGPVEIRRGRGMHWLRIDSYVDGGDYTHEPVACQHCEHAPCEVACPVGATVHSPDGLNEQVYNRCVGTRFCSNNCPYKVRRFNFFSNDREALHYNPDVTVRARGVMEKCTYCVQRIRRAEQQAHVEGRPIGEVTTACQDACPTRAIEFGAIGEPGPLQQRREDPRRYELLHHLGTRPRTQFLAKVRNRRSR